MNKSDWDYHCEAATLVAMAFIAVIGVAVVIGICVELFSEEPPLRAYHARCSNGSGTVSATGFARYIDGVRFYNVDGKKHNHQSLPPDCFVTVES